MQYRVDLGRVAGLRPNETVIPSLRQLQNGQILDRNHPKMPNLSIQVQKIAFTQRTFLSHHHALPLKTSLHRHPSHTASGNCRRTDPSIQLHLQQLLQIILLNANR